MRSYLSQAATVVATPPQSEPLNTRQVENSAGGFVFALDDWKRLDRFLILGSEGGTYYAAEKELTVENIKTVERCVALDGVKTVNRIVEISKAGRAPKNEPALLALAYAASKGNKDTRAHALAHLSDVARIGTHLFHFIEFATKFRGWGRGLREAVAEWYVSKTPDEMAEQVTKYAQRDGWSHRDLMRLAHPKFHSIAHQNIASYVVKGEDGMFDVSVKVPDVLLGAICAPRITDPKIMVRAIKDFGLVREHVPTQFLTDPDVWAALLEKMPLTAMIRNLGNMSKVGLLKPLSGAAKKIERAITDPVALKKARVHPLTILTAARTYAQGHGNLGKGTWDAVPQVIDALDTAYYMAFDNVEPTGKNFYLGLDISGSMWSGEVAGIAGFNPAVATGALAMVTIKTEKNYYAAGFTAKTAGRYGGRFDNGGTEMTPLTFSPKQRLDDVCNTMRGLSDRMGGTDCALPMLDAIQKKMFVDAFIIYTDNETWAGDIHPMQALQMYRNKFNPKAKLVVVGLTATEFSIADPTDAGMLDVVGFDAAMPAVIADFVKD